MNFEQYYKKYLTFHTKLWTRLIHCIGNLATLSYMLLVVVLGFSLWWLLASPFIIYLFAWPSHWFIEGNRPAAFKNPIYAKMADWRMMYEMVQGKL